MFRTEQNWNSKNFDQTTFKVFVGVQLSYNVIDYKVGKGDKGHENGDNIDKDIGNIGNDDNNGDRNEISL